MKVVKHGPEVLLCVGTEGFVFVLEDKCIRLESE